MSDKAAGSSLVIVGLPDGLQGLLGSLLGEQQQPREGYAFSEGRDPMTGARISNLRPRGAIPQATQDPMTPPPSMLG